jgi:hypothetical protein
MAEAPLYVWGEVPPAPPELIVRLFVTLPALVAVAALPPIDKPLAVPVRFVPGPLKYEVAVIVVPVMAAAVEAPIVVPLIVPPVIATAFAFCVDIVPRPETWAFEIAIEVFVTDETCPLAFVVITGTDDADP